jgi:hypothetical protein
LGEKNRPTTLLKSILRPKEELWKLKYFTIAKIYLNLQKNKSSKRKPKSFKILL